MTVSDILRALSEFAPPEYKMDFDNVGLLVGDPRAEVGKVMLSLDITSDVVREAAQAGAGLSVGHGAAEAVHAYLHEKRRGLGRIFEDLGDQSVFGDLICHDYPPNQQF